RPGKYTPAQLSALLGLAHSMYGSRSTEGQAQ
ncbi:unnamed protein product, partial [marine sediment metagenome]